MPSLVKSCESVDTEKKIVNRIIFGTKWEADKIRNRYHQGDPLWVTFKCHLCNNFHMGKAKYCTSEDFIYEN